MDLYLDGAPLADAVSSTSTLEEALRQVQTSRCRPRQLVVGVRCDGKDVPAQDLTSFLRRPVSSFGRLEVFTSTKEQLVLGAMSNASTSLQETEQACRRIAEQLIQGQSAEAIRSLADCLRVWQQIHDAVGKSLQMLELDAQQMMINDTPVVDVIGKPKDILVQVKQALQSGDHILLADLLQYEFGDVIDQWFSLIARLRQEAEDASGQT